MPALLPNLSSIRAQIAAGLSPGFQSKGVKRFDSGDGWDAFFGRSFGRMFGGLLPGATKDYEGKAGDVWLNSAASICLRWIDTSFREAPVMVGKVDANDKLTPIPKHPITRLLRRPNKHYSGQTLWAGTLISWYCAGDSYWYKDLANDGTVLGLWYIPHMLMDPVPSKTGDRPVERYDYYVRGRVIPYAPEQIVHLKNGMDPRAPWRGLSPLRAQLRNVVSDNEADSYAAAMLMNMGIPGLYVSPKLADKDVMTFLKSNAALIKERIMESTTGDKRGEPFISTMPVDISMLGYSPDQMALDKFSQRSESRVSGAFQVPPQVVGLAVGEGMKTYANDEEARLAAMVDCILPGQRDIDDQLSFDLLPHFRLDPEDFRVYHNTDNLLALQPVHNRRRLQAVAEYKGGVAKRKEARQTCGYEVDETEDDVYINEVTGSVPEEKAGDQAADVDETDKGAGKGSKALIKYEGNGCGCDATKDVPELWIERVTAEIEAITNGETS